MSTSKSLTGLEAPSRQLLGLHYSPLPCWLLAQGLDHTENSEQIFGQQREAGVDTTGKDEAGESTSVLKMIEWT